MTRGYIGLPGHGNVFRLVTEVCINNAAGGSVGGIMDNRMALTPSFSEGDAITCGATTTGAMICGNQCFEKVEDTWTNNPYLENGANHWGRNWKGIASLAMPA